MFRIFYAGFQAYALKTIILLIMVNFDSFVGWVCQRDNSHFFYNNIIWISPNLEIYMKFSNILSLNRTAGDFPMLRVCDGQENISTIERWV